MPLPSPGLRGATGVADVRHLPAGHGDDVREALAELAYHRRLEARVHLAVVAARVLAALPVVPVDVAEELLPRAVVLIADQVAGSLPAVRREGRVAPRRTGIVAQPRGELEEQRRGGDFRKAL